MHGQNTDPASSASASPSSSPVYRVSHDPDGTATLSTTVVHALADCLGIDVTESAAYVHDSVDPDALDALFRPRYDGAPRTGGSLVFHVHDYCVTVFSDGEIVIEPPTGPGTI